MSDPADNLSAQGPIVASRAERQVQCICDALRAGQRTIVVICRDPHPTRIPDAALAECASSTSRVLRIGRPLPELLELQEIIGAAAGVAGGRGKCGKPQLASHIGISRNSLAKILDLKCQNLSPRISQKVGSAIAALNSEASEEKKLLELAGAEIAEVGLSEFARRLRIDASNLNKITDGERQLSRGLAARFARYFKGEMME